MEKPAPLKRDKAARQGDMKGLDTQHFLVGGLEHGFYFPFHIWDIILPIDFHIFQDGWNHQPDFCSVYVIIIDYPLVNVYMTNWKDPPCLILFNE